MSEKCHGIVSLEHHMYIHDHDETLEDEVWEGQENGYTLIYVSKNGQRKRW